MALYCIVFFFLTHLSWSLDYHNTMRILQIVVNSAQVVIIFRSVSVYRYRHYIDWYGIYSSYWTSLVQLGTKKEFYIKDYWVLNRTLIIIYFLHSLLWSCKWKMDTNIVALTFYFLYGKNMRIGTVCLNTAVVLFSQILACLITHILFWSSTQFLYLQNTWGLRDVKAISFRLQRRFSFAIKDIIKVNFIWHLNDQCAAKVDTSILTVFFIYLNSFSRNNAWGII
jgi:hypothetical protein